MEGGMTLRDQIFVTWNYGKGLLLTGAVYNLVCTGLMVSDVSYAGFVDSFIIKVPVAAVTLLLFLSARSRDADFFYIDLGFSPRRMIIRILAIDFLMLAILLTIVLLVNGGEA